MTPAFHRQTESRRPFSGEPEGIAGDIRTFGELIFDFRGRSITESIERLQWVRRGGQPTRDWLRLARVNSVDVTIFPERPLAGVVP